MSGHGASAEEIGIPDGPTSMPEHFNVLESARDNSFDNIGRIGSFVDRGVGFGGAATTPFRYYKGALTEGGIRASAFTWFPSALPGNRIDNGFFTVMDLLPTFADIAGISGDELIDLERPAMEAMDGRSVWPCLTGRSSFIHDADDTARWSRGPQGEIGALVRGRYKLTNQPRPHTPLQDADLTWRLYDLEADPGETRDLARENPELVESLHRAWAPLQP